MLIGALLERPLGIRRSVLLAFGLSLAAELSQLTGLWGLYPCSYRKFDVDDLLLNTSGGALGAGLAGALRRRRGRA
jgi:glycopeptide antibiotics resistance protein